jgi:hypothetical protein
MNTEHLLSVETASAMTVASYERFSRNRMSIVRSPKEC